ncbi:hypothetical protein EU546_01140 [Candidatus Thorarchaeota archaeon]|nr:MAG: hypothetical protein EU546_01140 [Candidatus Thorarchaeota archaeon]
MVGVVLGIFVSHLGGRNFAKWIVPTAVMILIVLPYMLYQVLFYLEMTYELVNDWGGSGALGWGSIRWLPLVGVITGGFLGGYSGYQWSEYEERSCIACLMVPVSLVFLLSVMMVLL